MGAKVTVSDLTTTSLRRGDAASKLNQSGSESSNLIASTSKSSFLRESEASPRCGERI
jgi:hypothetical protein